MVFLSHLSEQKDFSLSSAGIGTCSCEWLSRFHRAVPSTSLNEWATKCPIFVSQDFTTNEV